MCDYVDTYFTLYPSFSFLFCSFCTFFGVFFCILPGPHFMYMGNLLGPEGVGKGVLGSLG